MRGGGDAHVSMPFSFQLEMNKMLIDFMSSEETFESFKSGCCENYTEWVNCAKKWGEIELYTPRKVGGNEVDQPEMKSDGDHNANANGDRGGGGK
jgi:hypothetical protein